MEDNPKSLFSTTRQEPSKVKTTSKPLIAETLKYTNTELTATGTNYSDTAKEYSPIKKARFLMFKRAKIKKVLMQLFPTLVILNILRLFLSVGKLDILTPRTRLTPLEMVEEECKSTDHSISNPECG